MKSASKIELKTSIVNSLDIFYRSVRVPLSLIDTSCQTVFCLPATEYQFWPAELVAEQKKIMLSRNMPAFFPYVLTDHFDIHTGMFHLPNDYLLVIGPVSSGSIDLASVKEAYDTDALPPEYGRAFLQAYQTTVPADIIRFANILSLAAHLLFRVSLDPIDILEANYPERPAPSSAAQDAPADSTALPGATLDEIILFENMLAEAVRTGNESYLQQALRTLHPLMQQMDIHSPVREFNISLPLLAVMRFSAIQGGADKEKSYLLYNHMITTLSEAASTGEHIASVTRAAKEYCRLVRESRFGEAHRETAKKIERYVTQHLSEHITLQDLAETCHLSQRQISRVFEEYFGMKMPDYIHRERISRSKTLLISSSLTINEIASRLGYASQSHFSSTFRKQTGITPGEFRKNPGREA